MGDGRLQRGLGWRLFVDYGRKSGAEQARICPREEQGTAESKVGDLVAM